MVVVSPDGRRRHMRNSDHMAIEKTRPTLVKQVILGEKTGHGRSQGGTMLLQYRVRC